jgi:hypothetical protein
LMGQETGALPPRRGSSKHQLLDHEAQESMDRSQSRRAIIRLMSLECAPGIPPASKLRCHFPHARRIRQEA